MTARAISLLSIALIGVMAAASAWAWFAAPETSQIAVHWNLSGKAVAFRSKEFALALAPGIALALSFVMAIMMWRTDKADIWAKRLRAAWLAGLLALALLHVFLVLAAASLVTVFGNYTALPPAVFLGIMGNYMAKGGTAAQKRTGRLLVFSSLATLVTWVFVPGPAAEIVIVVLAPLSMIVGGLFGRSPRDATLDNGA